jgi:hypothetical protein
MVSELDTFGDTFGEHLEPPICRHLGVMLFPEIVHEQGARIPHRPLYGLRIRYQWLDIRDEVSLRGWFRVMRAHTLPSSSVNFSKIRFYTMEFETKQDYAECRVLYG